MSQSERNRGPRPLVSSPRRKPGSRSPKGCRQALPKVLWLSFRRKPALHTPGARHTAGEASPEVRRGPSATHQALSARLVADGPPRQSGDPESRTSSMNWTPASAGVTSKEASIPLFGNRFIALLGAAMFLIQPALYASPPPLPAFPPLELHPPKPVRKVLDNGLVLFLLEDHELPLIKLEMYVEGGTQADPLHKIGLGSLYGEVMALGGSRLYTPEDIEKTLNRKAASIGFSIGLENGSGTLSCRKEDFKEIFGLYQDLLLHPQFRKDKFEITKAKALESLRRMNDDPDDVSRREFRRVMYGSAHPYARIPSPAMIKNIKRDDLLGAHKRYFRPNGAWMAVTGDFVTEEMLAHLQNALGSWEKSETTWPPVPAPPPLGDRRVFYIQRPLNQSQIRVGDFGLIRHSPDHFAWEVFNELWGGSAGSRLFRKVRTEQGLAYSVGSGYTEPPQRGLVVAVCQTRGSQTMAAIQSILKISQETRDALFTDQEISDAKEAIRNRFIENFTSSAQIASYRMSLEFFGFPENYLETYTRQIAQVTRQDLQRVGKTYLHPDRMTILVIGDLSTFDKPISTLGRPLEIRPLDYSQDE